MAVVDPIQGRVVNKTGAFQPQAVIAAQDREIVPDEQRFGVDEDRDLAPCVDLEGLSNRRRLFQVLRKLGAEPAHRIKPSQHPVRLRRAIEGGADRRTLVRRFNCTAHRLGVDGKLSGAPLREPDHVDAALLQLRDVHLDPRKVFVDAIVLDRVHRVVAFHVEVGEHHLRLAMKAARFFSDRHVSVYMSVESYAVRLIAWIIWSRP